MLALEVGLEELVSRLLNRGKTSGRSDDTNESIIRARIVEYENKTAPVAGHYEQFGKVKGLKAKALLMIFFGAISSHIEAKSRSPKAAA